MSYDRRTRDRFRLLVTGLTGAAGVGAITATGLLMGLASRDFADQQTADQGQQAGQPTQGAKAGARKARASARRAAPEPRLRQRPYVTRVTVRYVPEGGANPVGSTGAVSAPSAPAPDAPAPAPAPAADPAPAPAPAPDPPPAPSSGS